MGLLDTLAKLGQNIQASGGIQSGEPVANAIFRGRNLQQEQQQQAAQRQSILSSLPPAMQQQAAGLPTSNLAALAQKVAEQGVRPQITKDVQGVTRNVQTGQPLFPQVAGQRQQELASQRDLTSKKLDLDSKKFDLETRKFERDFKRGGLTDKETFDRSTKLRKEFTTLSDAFITQRDAFSRIEVLASQTEGLDEEALGATDIALIFNFMKVQDPGSVVRESEFATAENAGGVSERVRNIWNKLQTGQKLTPRQRKDFLDTSKKIFGQSQKSHDKRIDEFTRLSEVFDVSPEGVIIDISKPEAAGIRTPAEETELQELLRLQGQ